MILKMEHDGGFEKVPSAALTYPVKAPTKDSIVSHSQPRTQS